MQAKRDHLKVICEMEEKRTIWQWRSEELGGLDEGDDQQVRMIGRVGAGEVSVSGSSAER